MNQMRLGVSVLLTIAISTGVQANDQPVFTLRVQMASTMKPNR